MKKFKIYYVTILNESGDTIDNFFGDSELLEYMLKLQDEYGFENINKIVDSNYEDISVDNVIKLLNSLKYFNSQAEFLEAIEESGLPNNSKLLKRIENLFARYLRKENIDLELSLMIEILKLMPELSNDDINKIKKKSLSFLNTFGNDYYSIYAFVKYNTGYSLNEIEVLIYRMKRCPSFYLQYKSLIDNIESAFNIADFNSFIVHFNKTSLKNIMKLFSDYSEYCERSYMDTKSIADYEVVNKIDGVKIRYAPDDFALLISVVRNKSALSEASDLVKNYLRKYHENAKPSKQSLHSLSFINAKNTATFGLKDEREYIFGYQGYQNGFLVGASSNDNNSVFRDDHIIDQLHDLEIDAENLMRSSTSIYNEVTAYRVNEITYEVLEPKCSICYDEINAKALRAAKKFKVDVVLIPKEKYMAEAYRKLTTNGEAVTLNEKIECLKLYERFLNTYLEYSHSLKTEAMFWEIHEKYQKVLKDIEQMLKEEHKRILSSQPKTCSGKMNQVLEMYNLYIKSKYLYYSLMESYKFSESTSPICSEIIDIDDIDTWYIFSSFLDLMKKFESSTSKITIDDWEYFYQIYPMIKISRLKIRFSDLFKNAYLLMKNLPSNVISALKDGLNVFQREGEFLINPQGKDIPSGFTKIEIPLSSIKDFFRDDETKKISVIYSQFLSRISLEERYEMACIKLNSGKFQKK